MRTCVRACVLETDAACTSCLVVRKALRIGFIVARNVLYIFLTRQSRCLWSLSPCTTWLKERSDDSTVDVRGGYPCEHWLWCLHGCWRLQGTRMGALEWVLSIGKVWEGVVWGGVLIEMQQPAGPTCRPVRFTYATALVGTPSGKARRGNAGVRSPPILEMGKFNELPLGIGVIPGSVECKQ